MYCAAGLPATLSTGTSDSLVGNADCRRAFGFGFWADGISVNVTSFVDGDGPAVGSNTGRVDDWIGREATGVVDIGVCGALVLALASIAGTGIAIRGATVSDFKPLGLVSV